MEVVGYSKRIPLFLNRQIITVLSAHGVLDEAFENIQRGAVDCPEFIHLVDVIVFPREGYRPLPSMLSGGDLDGDLFFVIFDPRVALLQRSEIGPMDYSASKPITLNRSVTWHDVADFFVEFIINNDCIGLVANAHVVHADKRLRGVFSQQCRIRLTWLSTVIMIG